MPSRREQPPVGGLLAQRWQSSSSRRGVDTLVRRPWQVSMAALAIGLTLGDSPLWIPLVTGGTLAAGLATLGAPRLAAVAAALVLAGAWAGEVRLAAIDAPARLVRDEEHATLRGTLLTPPRPNDFGSTAELKVGTGHMRGARLLLRAPHWSPMPRGIGVGDELAVVGEVRSLAAMRRGGTRPRAGVGSASGSGSASGAASFDFAAYLRRRGIAGELLLDRARATGRRRGGLPGALDRMRERSERGVLAGMDSWDGALLAGMVLGRDESIDAATRDDFRASGLAHLLAVSGQNVMLLAALALPVLIAAGAGLRGRFVVLAVLIALYVPLAGAGPSLQRAGVMGLAGIAAAATSRPASRWYALLLAAAATLAWNPLTWADPGWQLSFAAVAGILVLGVPLDRALRSAAEQLRAPRADALAARGVAAGPARARAGPARVGRFRASLLRALTDGLAITVAATLATAPLLAFHFGSVPVAGLPANLLALPAVAPAMWLGMVKCALGQLGAPGQLLARPLGAVASLPVGYLAWLAGRCADLPAGQLRPPLRSPVAALGAYAVLAAAALAVRRLGVARSTALVESAARWRRLPRGRRTALIAAVAVTVAAGTAVALAGPDPPSRLTVRFLDVGQGDATLIQDPDGTAVLFDGGPPEAGVTRLLRKAGVRRLAAVVATHASRDHHGGLADVLRRFPVGVLLDGGDGTRDPTFRALEHEAADRGVRIVPAIAPLSVALAGGAMRIRVLSPPPRSHGPAPEDPNERAVVAIVSDRGFDLLLSADAESDALLPLHLPDVDAMKVPHHGSADPGLPEVLHKARPEIAAIEVGAHNTYGHPAAPTLAVLRHAHVRTYRTDRDGTITLTLDGGEMALRTER